MVEAALVFPIVILAVMALIWMLIFLYGQTESRAQMHIALRAESGRVSQTVEYLTKVKADYPIYSKGSQVYFRGVMHFEKTGLLNRGEKSFFAYKYADSEKSYIRLVDLGRRKERPDGK